MLFDPLFFGNVALFAAVFGSGFLEIDDPFRSSDEDEVEDEPDPIVDTAGTDGSTGVDLFRATDDADSFAINDAIAATYNLLGGNDTLDAGLGNDTVDAGSGDDLVFGRLGHDEVALGAGDDTGFGGFGDDTIAGGAGDDSILGEAGADILQGDDGADTLKGNADDDRLEGGAGDDLLEGGEGADLLRGGVGADTLNGTYAGGTLSRTNSPDLADTLDGGLGDDVLILGARDQATGGDGADAFVVDVAVAQTSMDGIAPNGPTIITDFDLGTDTLAVEFTGATPDEDALRITDLDDGSGVTVSLNGTDLAIVRGGVGLTPDQIQLIEV